MTKLTILQEAMGFLTAHTESGGAMTPLVEGLGEGEWLSARLNA